MHQNVFGCGSKLLGNNHVMKLIPKNLEIANLTWNYVLPHRNSPQARKISINDEIFFTPEIKKTKFDMHHNVFGCGSKLLGKNHVMKLIPKNLEIANST